MTDSSNQLKTLGSELHNKSDNVIVTENNKKPYKCPTVAGKTVSDNSLVVEIFEAAKDSEKKQDGLNLTKELVKCAKLVGSYY